METEKQTTEKRIQRIIDAKKLFGYTAKELETRSELGYATIGRVINYFTLKGKRKHTPRKTTLKTLETILGLDR